MTPFFILAVGAVGLGAIFGSFLNALSFRFNTGRGMGGRSRCMHCGHGLSTLDLVPVFSFLFLGGKCRYCHARISWQYALVECAAALLSLGVYLTLPLGRALVPTESLDGVWAAPAAVEYAFWFLVWMTILFVVVYDLRHKVIPWSCSGLLAILALVYLAGHHTNMVGVVAGPLLALPLFLMSLGSGGRWMGWGDSAFELSLGWFLGLTQGLSALLLGFWSGALVGIVLLVATKRVTMKSEIPFAPFLALGAALAYFFHVDLFPTLSLL